MRGLGTIINVACIVVGGIVGFFAGNRLKENIRETLMTITGVGVIILGIGGAVSRMLVYENGRFDTSGTIMMIVCLSIGAVIGELLKINDKIVSFGEWLKKKTGSERDNGFVSSFVSASCTVCIGAMAIIGAITDGISGDYSILAAKGILDLIIICIMAASQGKGCIFSAIPVGILQGLFTLLAVFIGDFLPAASLDNLSLVGSVLIFCVGLNLIRDKQIHVANTLPATLIAVIWGFFQG